MKLKRYRVTDFRSVKDSGWIECDDVTTLVGINESGKSNLLLALWKLNPAREGIIDILHDMPVSELSSLRKKADEVCFISAEFEFDKDKANDFLKQYNCRCNKNMVIIVSRFYSGRYEVELLNDLQMEDENSNGNDISSDDTQTEYDEQKLKEALIDEIPKFVYYSNYGNLSSKIYLPNVIKWLNGDKTPGIEINEEQVRTLRVLFEFVKLDPKEILDLGKDPKIIAMERMPNANSKPVPSKAEIEKAENDKEERSILLQSASGMLTKQFREWWKQGEYKFRFEADGDYFRIMVSDAKRTEEVGLELRSTGLQWFLSFYLIFLVESQMQHKNAVLLLDEAGLTLHPLAQKDLAKFFEGLSEQNQIINTTHSPFVIDTSNIDRCRVVYTDKDGFTVASGDLRQGDDALNEKSIYAVHAAMGLSVSDILLQGCQVVVVEGPSDQHYFNAIKTFLIKGGKISPKQEIVFVPSGGVKGVPGVVSIVCGKSDKLPFVILDSDKSGRDAKTKLQSGLYKDCKEHLLEVKDYIQIENSEVEDLIPYNLKERGINRLFNGVEDVYFDEQYDSNKAIVPQIEEFAKNNNIELEKGWKVDIAKITKQVLRGKDIDKVDDSYIDIWVKLFERLNSM